MMFGLFADGGFPEYIGQIPVGCPCPQGASDVYFPIGQEARPQLPAGGEAEPVAVPAEVMTHGTYEADFSHASLKFEPL